MPWFFVILFLLPLSVPGQNPGTLKGKVTDETGKGLPNAHVLVKESAKGLTTQNDGTFQFSRLPYNRYTLIVSYMGFEKTVKSLNFNQESSFIHVQLKPESFIIDDIAVVSEAKKNKIESTSMNLEIIDKDNLEKINSGSLMQDLSSMAGINSMDIGAGFSKPMIRGLGFNRVVVSENGMKYEGQQWGVDHGLVIDKHNVENVEVIKGPASLIYGSDALGGVINIIPNSIPEPNTLKAELFTTAKSNNHLFGSSLMTAFRKNKLFFHGRGSVQSYGDYHVPADNAIYNSYNLELNGKLINTAGREEAFALTTGMTQDWGHTKISFSNVKNEIGFFAKVHGLELRLSDIDYEKSSRNIDLPYQEVNHFKMQSNSSIFFGTNHLKLNFQYQNNLRQEKNELYDVTGNRKEELKKWNNLSLELEKSTFSGKIEYQIKPDLNRTITIGAEGQTMKNEKGGFNFIIPDFQKESAGTFLHYNLKINDKWRINLGSRLDYGKINAKEYVNPFTINDMDSVRSPDFSYQESDITYAGGISFTPSKQFIMKINLGKSFRLPTVNELASNGYHHGAFRYEKGDTAIKSEHSYQLDLAFRLQTEKLEISITPFINYFPNYIFITPTPEFNADFKAGQIYKYQENKALRAGSEFELNYSVNQNITSSIRADYLFAKNLDRDSSLPFTPPASVLGKIEYEKEPNIRYLQQTYISLQSDYKTAQNHVVPNEPKTPASLLFHFGAGAQFHLGELPVQIRMQIRNLTNKKYYNHLSYYRRLEIPEPGRNIQMSAKILFNNKL